MHNLELAHGVNEVQPLQSRNNRENNLKAVELDMLFIALAV